MRERDALERLTGVRCIAFDKTGTLTCGKLAVTMVKICGLMTEAELLAAASAELRYEHPLGRVIVVCYKEQK